MQLNNPASINDLEDCRYTLKVLETEAYSAVINALRAQGPFNQYYHLILEHLRVILNVSIDRHKAEIRRALADPTLLKVATGLNTQTDVTFDWTEEAKRSCGNASFPTALALESPSFYRFSFLRTCKNDLLLELADHLAMMAVQHNRFKSMENGEEKMFQTLKRQKTVPPVGNREKIDGAATISKPMEKPTTAAETAPSTAPARSKTQTASMRRKAVQKDAAELAVNKILNMSPPSVPAANTATKKNAGRPRKQPAEVPMPKQRLGQIIAARSAAAVRGDGASGYHQRGRGAKKLTTMSKAALTAGMQSSQRVFAGRIGPQHATSHPSSTQLYGGLYSKTPPRTPPRQMPILTPSTPPVVNNQPGSGQKTATGRHIRKRPAFTVGAVPTWPPGAVDSKSSFGSSGGRVPVAPLSMLPVSMGAMAKGFGGSSRFFTGPASPTRASLTGEAPGVYADDYNANAVDTSDLRAAVHSSPEAHVQTQPHQFFSSLSATYFAQNTPPPPKNRRLSPGASTSLSTHMVPSIAPSSRMTGITVKAKNGDGNEAETILDPGVTSAKASVGDGSLGLGSATLPVRQNTGQKLIVLPSAFIRRAQATVTSAPAQNPDSLKSGTSQGGKQQSVIIVRRAPSLPSAAAASSSSVVSTSSTPTPSSTPAPPTPTMSTPPESHDDPK